jgi:hypothetical protein
MALIGQTKWLTAVYFNPVQMESGEAVAQSDEGEDGITSHATAEEAKRPEIADETLLGVGEGGVAEIVTHTTKASPDNTIADEMFSEVQAFAVHCSSPPPDLSGIL